MIEERKEAGPLSADRIMIHGISTPYDLAYTDIGLLAIGVLDYERLAVPSDLHHSNSLVFRAR